MVARRRAPLIALGLIAAAVQTRSAFEQQARVLTSVTDTEMQRGYFDRAMRMALQGLPPQGPCPGSSPPRAISRPKLSGAAMASRLKTQMSGHTDKINSTSSARTASTRSRHRPTERPGCERRGRRSAGNYSRRPHGSVDGPRSYSPDGSRIVTASDDKTARLWDAGNRQADRHAAVGHSDVVNRAAFSPDGARTLTYSFDHTARLWDASTGAPIAVLEGPSGHRRQRRVQPGRQPHCHRVPRWNGRILGRAARHEDSSRAKDGRVDGHVQDVAFNTDGSRLLVISDVQSSAPTRPNSGTDRPAR